MQYQDAFITLDLNISKPDNNQIPLAPEYYA